MEAVRSLRSKPGFTAAVVLSLSAGIGAATAVFSIADTVFLRPLPYPDSAQLVWVGVRFPSMNSEFMVSPDYVAWRRDNHVFQQLAATQANPPGTMLLGGPEPAQVYVAKVSANFLDTFSIHPALGRTFRANEELPDGPKAVLLTHQFWRDHFAQRRDVLGSGVTLDGQQYTIAGILPASFQYPMDAKVDLLTTLPVSPTATRHDRTMSTWATYGRLRPGVTVIQALADMNLLFAAAKADAPKMYRADNRLIVQPLREHRAGNVRTLLLILIGAAGCLLTIACANVANLLLAHWSARAQEFAVRAAIGASRGRLARQLFSEIAVIIVAATGLAIIFVDVALRGFVHFAGRALPRLTEVGVDYRVFAIALLVSIVTGAVFGGLPILRAGRVDLQAVLQQAGRTSTGAVRLATRRMLVAVEVSLSVVLLSGSALMIQTLWHLRNDHLGFTPEHLLTASIPLRGARVPPATADLLADLRRIPGVEAAEIVQCTPLTGGIASITFSRSDRPLPEPFHRGDSVGVCGVGPDYLKTAGVPLKEGRFIHEEDAHHPGTVAVINEASVRAYFPGEDPIGKQILGGRAGNWKTVIGVIADTKNAGLNHPPEPQVLINDTTPAAGSQLLFLVRSLAPESAIANAFHSGFFTRFQTLTEDMDEMTASPRFNTILFASFAALAVLMAIVGVYGVLAFSVAQRRREIGIRMALGASPQAVLGLVMREGATLVVLGAVIGLIAALALTRYLASLLYGVKANNPETYVLVVLLLTLAGLAASFLPARRAAVVDPLVALRDE